jgi:DNA-directed RNA polymerase subunit RPC12/RpoP
MPRPSSSRANGEAKLCTKCGEVKSIDDYYNNSTRVDGKAVHCKACWEKEYREKSPEKRKRSQLLVKYGVTWEDYLDVLDLQGYKCAICKRELNVMGDRKEKNNSAHVDHNHSTGKPRGILCAECNSGLGYFKESIDILNSAITYLEIHSI